MRQYLPHVVVLLVAVAGTVGVVAGVHPGTAVAPSTDTTSPANASSSASTADASRTITVDATGRATSAPNRVTVRLSVVETADGPGDARAEVARNASKLRDALRRVGVGDDAVATARYDLRYDENPDIDADGPYRAEHAFVVSVSTLEKAGTVVDTAAASAGARIDGVEFGLSTERRRTLQQRALTDAMTNARSKAGTLAVESNLSITGVETVETSTADRGPSLRYDSVTTSAAQAAPPTDFAGGPVNVVVRVVVTYRAAPA